MSSSEADSSFEWVRPPQQARSQRSLERILTAAEELIGRQGFANTAVADIVRKAKCSVGTFYARFRDKEALLHVLHEQLAVQAVVTTEAALARVPSDASILELARPLIAFVAHIYAQRPQLILAVLFRVPNDREIARRAESMNRAIAEKLGELLSTRSEQIAHDDPHRAADFAMRLVFGMLHERYIFGGILEGGLDDEAFTEEVAQAFTAYLCAPREAA